MNIAFEIAIICCNVNSKINYSTHIRTVIELACCEYGEDKMQLMVHSTGNGECLDWFDDPSKILKLEELRTQYPLSRDNRDSGQLEATSSLNQLTILLKRGYLKGKRDTTLTYLRLVRCEILSFFFICQL